MVRTYITELLTDTPWRVCGEAADGSDALQTTRELKPDLVLLDVSMPGTNGLEIANIIRQELPAVKIVVAGHHDLKQLLSSDGHQLADGFVDKDRMGLDCSQRLQEHCQKMDLIIGPDAISPLAI